MRIAQEKQMDLIEISPTANPPVAKIMEFGKFLYQERRREKEGRKGQKTGTKIIRFSVRTSGGDLHFRASQVDKFLQKRYKVRIQMILRGREKSLRDFANQRLKNFLSLITEPYKEEQEPKNFPMGIMMIITKK
jgi:translation initiation factor IF-3